MPIQLAHLMFTYDALAGRFEGVHYVLRPGPNGGDLPALLTNHIEPALRDILALAKRTDRGCQITHRKIYRDHVYHRQASTYGSGVRAQVQLNDELDTPERSSLDLSLYDCELAPLKAFHHGLLALPGLDASPCQAECTRLELLLAQGPEADPQQLSHAVRVAAVIQAKGGGQHH